MYITDNIDPAFRYEDLARFAFDNCLKYGDPWNYAAQEVYANFMKNIDLKGKRILSTILNKLIFDNRNKAIYKDLIKIEEVIWTINLQEDAIAVIDKTINILENS